MFFRKRDEEKVRVEHIKDSRAMPVHEDMQRSPSLRSRNPPDFEEIKNAMEEQPTLQTSQPSANYDDYPLPKERPNIEKPAYEETYTTGAQGAPLFVKVEKYRDVLRDVYELKLYTSGIKQLLDLMHDIETIRTDANKVLRATVQRIEKTLVEVDSELLRPRGAIMSEIAHEDTEVRHVESALAGLQKQLSDLKKDLQSFK